MVLDTVRGEDGVRFQQCDLNIVLDAENLLLDTSNGRRVEAIPESVYDYFCSATLTFPS